MRKDLIALVAVLALAAAGIYFYFSGKEYEFRFTESQLQEQLDTKLPLTRSYLLIFEVTLDNPRVSLSDESNRVLAGLDIILNMRVGDEPRPLEGTIDVSGGVRYVPNKGRFFITDPIIEHLEVQGVPGKYAQTFRTAMTKAIAEYYLEHPIYTLRANDVKQATARLVLKDVVVEGHTLVVTLGV